MLLNWLTEKRASVVDAPVAVSAAAAAAVALEPLEPAAGVDGGEARRRRSVPYSCKLVPMMSIIVGLTHVEIPTQPLQRAVLLLPTGRMYIFYVWLVRVRA